MLEQLLMSLKVMVLGFGTVFIALVALIFVIELVNKLLNIELKVSGKQDIDSQESLKDQEHIQGSIELEENTIAFDDDEEEIIAVISAAIAASLSRSTHDIIVRSVRRVPQYAPAWRRAGQNQQISGRL